MARCDYATDATLALEKRKAEVNDLAVKDQELAGIDIEEDAGVGDIDGDDRPHHALEVMDRTRKGHRKPRLCRADWSDWVNPALV